MSSDENDERLITNVEELMHTVTGLTSDLSRVMMWASVHCTKPQIMI